MNNASRPETPPPPLLQELGYFVNVLRVQPCARGGVVDGCTCDVCAAYDALALAQQAALSGEWSDAYASARKAADRDSRLDGLLAELEERVWGASTPAGMAS